MSKFEKTGKMKELVSASRRRAEERRAERIKNKAHTRYYTYGEVEKIVKTSLAKLKENIEIQTAVCLANVLEKEPYDFNRAGICDTISKTFDLIAGINNESVDPAELIKVANKHGVSLKKSESSVQVILDRGDDTNGGKNDS